MAQLPESAGLTQDSATVRQAVRNAALGLGIVAVLLLLAYHALNTISSARAYVGGEGLWSKAQKDAVYHLLRYAHNRDPADFTAFNRSLDVPLGDRQARLELERARPDYDRVREGFLRGGNHRDDVDRMATFYRRFRSVSFVSAAIGYWTEGDSRIGLLQQAGSRLHGALRRGAPDSMEVERALQDVHAIDLRLRVLEDSFSRVLGEGARQAAWLGFAAIAVTAALLLGLAGFSEWHLIRRSRTAEASLRESEARHRSLIENAGFGICRTGPDGRILSANPALVRALGYDTAEEVKGLDLVREVYRSPGDRERLAQWFVVAGRVRGDFEVELNRRDGTPLLARITARAMHNTAGRLEGIEWFVEDVTGRRALESQLRQAQKMEVVGQLTGGIAHDFNNILTVILSHANLIETVLPAGPSEARADLAELKDAARRGAEMIRKLLVFSRTRQLQFRPLALNDLVQASAAVLRRVLPAHIEMRVDSGAAALCVRTDPAVLEQILLNLATNARDAMPAGGTLEISVSLVDRPQKGGDSWARLTVRDTGEGMNAGCLERLFEPFFTTKAPGHGTGLGMTMVYGLVRQHGGEIEVDSAPGQGTSVHLYFPQAEPQVPVESTAVASPAGRGKGTILLVEDEEALRRATQRLLERHGYQVVPAEDGMSALAIFDARGAEIDLVLSDVMMPRLGGGALYEELRQRGATVPVLLVSGYVARDTPGAVPLPEGVPFLPKPWDIEDLLRKVDETLDAASPDPLTPPRHARSP